MTTILKEFIQSELNKIQYSAFDVYYGSDEQIKNEELILNKTNIKMKDRESIEEYYSRIYNVI